MKLTVRTLMFVLLLSGCGESADEGGDDVDTRPSTPEPRDTPEGTGRPNDGGGPRGTVGNGTPRDAGSDPGKAPAPADAGGREVDAEKDAGPRGKPDSTVIGPKDPFAEDPLEDFPNPPVNTFKPILQGVGFTTTTAGAKVQYDKQAYVVHLMDTAAGCVLTIDETKVHNTIVGAGDVYIGDVLVASGGKCVVASVEP